MKEITVDVIIPVYRPGERFGELLKRLDLRILRKWLWVQIFVPLRRLRTS